MNAFRALSLLHQPQGWSVTEHLINMCAGPMALQALLLMFLARGIYPGIIKFGRVWCIACVVLMADGLTVKTQASVNKMIRDRGSTVRFSVNSEPCTPWDTHCLWER